MCGNPGRRILIKMKFKVSEIIVNEEIVVHFLIETIFFQ